MSLPMANASAAPVQARFTHENGTQLRMQCFLIVRDEKDRVATMTIQGYEGACLAGESMLLNESPDDAAVRVAKSWFDVPLGMMLDRVLSFPATGADDDRWYVIFVYHADAPANLKGTPDTLKIEFHGKDDPPAQFAMSHREVWDQLW